MGIRKGETKLVFANAKAIQTLVKLRSPVVALRAVSLAAVDFKEWLYVVFCWTCHELDWRIDGTYEDGSLGHPIRILTCSASYRDNAIPAKKLCCCFLRWCFSLLNRWNDGDTEYLLVSWSWLCWAHGWRWWSSWRFRDLEVMRRRWSGGEICWNHSR